MAISLTDKNKTEKLIEKIELASFDENDIDLLFMKVRQFCGGFTIIREIADFVAHTDERNKGITHDALHGFYLSLKYFDEYGPTGSILDLSKPFPSYIQKLLKSQLKKCDQAEFKASTGLSRSKFNEMLDRITQVDLKSDTCIFKSQPDQKAFNAIKHLLSFISGKAAYTGDEIIEQLILVLRKNSFKFDEKRIREQADRMIICVLLLIHNTIYDFKGYKTGRCMISCGKASIIKIPSDSNIPGIKSVPNEGHGNLRIVGRVTFLHQNKEAYVAFPVLDTSLKAIEWCDKNMVSLTPVGSTSLTQEFIDFDTELHLEEGFILSKI